MKRYGIISVNILKNNKLLRKQIAKELIDKAFSPIGFPLYTGITHRSFLSVQLTHS